MTGTAAAEIFTASLGRLQSADALDGAGGADVLNARLGATVTPVIANIETLNIEATSAASLDGANITGATNVNVTGGATLTYLAQDAEAFSVAGAGTGLTVTRTATDTTADAITVTLKDGKLGSVTLGDKQTTDYETVNLIIAGAGSATLVEADSGTNTESFADTGDKIVVTGSGDYELAIADGLLGSNATAGSEASAVIDASGHTGKLTVNLGALTTTNNVSAEKFTGVDAIKLQTAAANSDVNIITKVASGTEIIVDDIEAADNILKLTPNGTATTDTLTLTLADVTKGESITLANVVTDGFETVTINSGGTATATSDIKNIINGLDGLSTDKNLILAGSTALVVNAIEATFTNIEVTNTAGVDVSVDTGGAVKFTGGSAADRFEFDTVADLTKADSVNGGDGKDTIAFSAIPAALDADQLGAISNFEVVEFRAANTLTAAVVLDITTESGLNEVRFNGDLVVDDGATNTYTMTIKGVDGLTVNTGVVTNTATGGTPVSAFILDVKDAANAGTNNTVNVNLLNAGASDIVNAGFVIDNVENLNIRLTGDGDADGADKTTISLIDGAQLSSIVVTSTNTGKTTAGDIKASDDLVITAVETTMLSNFDASLSTGKVDMRDISAFVATGATIKGGSDNDLLTGGVGADVMTGGKGDDTLNGDQGNDSIDGGAGADNINGDVGADTLTGGAGADVFVVDATESTETAMDKITDFKALAADQDFDTLDLTSTTVQANVAIGSAVDVKAATTQTDTDVKAYIATGIIKLTGAEAGNVDTLAEWIDVAEIMLNAGASADSTGIVAFEFSGSTYVVREAYTHTGTSSVTDTVIQLVGVTGITGVSTTEAANVIHVA